MKNLFAFLLILTMASCKGSAFGGGLWFIPLVSGLGAGYSFFKFFNGLSSEPNRSKAPLIYGIVLAGFTIGAILLMLNEK